MTPAAPGAVTGLSVKIDGDNVIATWTAPSPAPTGQYHIKVDNGSGSQVIEEVWRKKTVNRASFPVWYAGNKKTRAQGRQGRQRKKGQTSGCPGGDSPPGHRFSPCREAGLTAA